MQPESPKLLEDVRCAAQYIVRVTRGKTFSDYISDELLAPAVERHFEIIGEALNRPRKTDPQLLDHIDDHAQIIAFRNVLIHGYDAIDPRRVWYAIENSLPILHDQVVKLLEGTNN
ncbi:MAG TPA: HepT-like ribonuclease domain-containing protein [Tepidisphaeraceae bacterium]|nr:HepT-like ribonuclease domain-containing protein [Tepidisphaeraceae bacterium]